MSYENRWYRDNLNNKRFRSFTVKYLETDLWIGIDPGSYHEEIETYCSRLIVSFRKQLDDYIKGYPLFQNCLTPLPFDTFAPYIAQEMFIQSQNAAVGPMACVAGAFSQIIGNEIIKKYSPKELIIENGGDIFLLAKDDINIAVYAGKSILSNKIGICITPNVTPLGICTSSATVGPSMSLGKSDATMIVCKNTALADGYASFFGNMVKSAEDINPVIEKIKNNLDVLSAIIIMGDKFGICGKFKMKLFS
jgi:uncharacterized protein